MNFKEKTDRSYKYHSVQLNVGREKDYFFQNLQNMIPDGIVYSEIIGEEKYNMLGSSFTRKIDKYGRENEPHVTVCYGLTNESDYFGVRRYLSDYPKFSINLGEISYFSDDTKPFDVCKVEIISPELIEITIIYLRGNISPEAGIEPATNALTVRGSTAELLRNSGYFRVIQLFLFGRTRTCDTRDRSPLFWPSELQRVMSV